MVFVLQDASLGVQSLDLSQSFNATQPWGFGSYKFSENNNALNQTVQAFDPYLGAGRFIYVQAPSTNTSGATISSIAITGTSTVTSGGTTTPVSIATVTTASAHSLVPGTKVIMAGQVPSNYAGTVVVLTTPSTTTFTYAVTGVSIAATTVGTYTYGTIRPGAVVALTQGISSGYATLTAALWDGTANTGRSLGFAYTSLLANEYGWVQVQGNTVINAGAISGANAPLYYGGTAGYVSTGSTAGKQILNAQSTASIGTVIGAGTDAVTLPSATTTSSQAVAFINYPFAQGAIT